VLGLAHSCATIQQAGQRMFLNFCRFLTHACLQGAHSSGSSVEICMLWLCQLSDRMHCNLSLVCRAV
jgi:hypothetical protein